MSDVCQVPFADISPDSNIHRCLPLCHPKFLNSVSADDDSVPAFDKCKCRMTFNGSSQVQGVDHFRSDTNNPRHETWRLHCATVNGATTSPDGTYNLPSDPDDNFSLKGDVPMAYANAVPKSVVLVELPRDLAKIAISLGLAVADPSGRVICRVLRCQYGQCDSGRNWEDMWVADMLSRGFRQSELERCPFHRGSIRVLCHTDDFPCRGSKTECLAFAEEMNQRWGDCKIDLLPSEIPSWNISHGEGNTMTLSSLGQINSMLKDLGMSSTFPRYTPLPASADPSTWKSSEHVGVTKVVQSMNGSLNHIAQTARPDMAFACNQFGSSQYMPSMAVIPSLRHSYKYMHATKYWGLRYSSQYTDNSCPVNFLDCWVDASDGDGPKSRSQTGFITCMNGGAVDWASLRQSTTSLSTAESELKASCTAARSAVFLTSLITEFGYPPPSPMILHEDNTTTVKWSLPHGPSLSDKNKHISRQFFYVQGLQSQSPPALLMEHVPSVDQLADLLTKNLPRVVHNRLCARLFVDSSSGAPLVV